MGNTFSTSVFHTASELRKEPKILRVTRRIMTKGKRTDLLFLTKKPSKLSRVRYCNIVQDCVELNEGDIVRLFPTGKITRLWNVNSIHNALFVTGTCNIHCKMCPQPVERDNPEIHLNNLRILSLLSEKEVSLICITGGEPFLFPDRIMEYFSIINKKFPLAEVEILTNATCLANFDLAKRIALAAPLNTMYCVSLHADTSDVYTRINQVEGSFQRTVQGITNLAKLQQAIELRPVIMAENAPYLEDIARFFYRNFPYVVHVAFMGLEVTGEAVCNFDSIWIEPMDYIPSLCRAVSFLEKLGMNVSIYNIPLCLLPSYYHSFAARSISDWKQHYLPTCESCSLRERCCGFFITSGKRIPCGIHPITDTI